MGGWAGKSDRRSGMMEVAARGREECLFVDYGRSWEKRRGQEEKRAKCRCNKVAPNLDVDLTTDRPSALIQGRALLTCCSTMYDGA